MSQTDGSPGAPALEGEDGKLVILARAAQARAYPLASPAEGAAVRDTDGRTYTAATVAHSVAALTTSALRGAVSAAVSSGARTFEAAVVVTSSAAIAPADLAVLAQFGFNVPVHAVAPDGTVMSSTTT